MGVDTDGVVAGDHIYFVLLQFMNVGLFGSRKLPLRFARDSAFCNLHVNHYCQFILRISRLCVPEL